MVSELAVAKGLVLHRAQVLARGFQSFDQQYCPFSIGLVCRELYNPVMHIGEPVSRDPIDRRYWAEDQINWLVKQEGFLHRNSNFGIANERTGRLCATERRGLTNQDLCTTRQGAGSLAAQDRDVGSSAR